MLEHTSSIGGEAPCHSNAGTSAIEVSQRAAEHCRTAHVGTLSEGEGCVGKVCALLCGLRGIMLLLRWH